MDGPVPARRRLRRPAASPTACCSTGPRSCTASTWAGVSSPGSCAPTPGCACTKASTSWTSPPARLARRPDRAVADLSFRSLRGPRPRSCSLTASGWLASSWSSRSSSGGHPRRFPRGGATTRARSPGSSRPGRGPVGGGGVHPAASIGGARRGRRATGSSCCSCDRRAAAGPRRTPRSTPASVTGRLSLGPSGVPTAAPSGRGSRPACPRGASARASPWGTRWPPRPPGCSWARRPSMPSALNRNSSLKSMYAPCRLHRMTDRSRRVPGGDAGETRPAGSPPRAWGRRAGPRGWREGASPTAATRSTLFSWMAPSRDLHGNEKQAGCRVRCGRGRAAPELRDGSCRLRFRRADGYDHVAARPRWAPRAAAAAGACGGRRLPGRAAAAGGAGVTAASDRRAWRSNSRGEARLSEHLPGPCHHGLRTAERDRDEDERHA